MVGGFDESVKKGKSVAETFFQKILNKVLKRFTEMISADVKAVAKQQEIKELLAVSCIFYEK